MFLKAGCVIDGKICMSERKIMKTVIVLEKRNHVFHHENIANKKTPLPERTLSFHCMYAVFLIASDRQ